jgi:hypothetical protein
MICLSFGSCNRLLGWGVLLWSSEDPAIPSGTLLPVYIRSNIDQAWVVGIPDEYRTSEDSLDKFEVRLWELEFVGNKKAAEERAAEFSVFARTYAETLQDGLPIRESPENNARRVYRLREGQIIKILKKSDGVIAVGATGDPLPGDWYQVLTSDGSIGYCFSYRLKLFEQTAGQQVASPEVETIEEDSDLDMIFAQKWYPDWYGSMIANMQIDLADISRRWNFDPGQDSGIARVYLPGTNLQFDYSSIKKSGSRTWVFEDTSLQMTLQSNTTLMVQYTEGTGNQQNQIFVTLPTSLDDVIAQESGRRESLFESFLDAGPVFHSENYGTLRFSAGNTFSWTGYNLLVPQTIPATVQNRGRVDMKIFLSRALQDRYNGVITLRFDGREQESSAERSFLYIHDSQGIRLEYLPESSLSGNAVTQRAASPIVMYFYAQEDYSPAYDQYFTEPTSPAPASDVVSNAEQ